MSDAAAMPRRTEYRESNQSVPAYLGPSCELDREGWCPPMAFLDAIYQGGDLCHSHLMQAQATNPRPPREAWQHLTGCCFGSLFFTAADFSALSSATWRGFSSVSPIRGRGIAQPHEVALAGMRK